MKLINLIQEQRLDGASKTPSHHALADGSALGGRGLDSLWPDPDLTATLAVADANTRGLGFAISFTAFLMRMIRSHVFIGNCWARNYFETKASTGRGMAQRNPITEQMADMKPPFNNLHVDKNVVQKLFYV